MTRQQLYDYVKDPETLDRHSLEELRALVERFPYFQTARMLYLKNLYLLHDTSFGEELRRAVAYVADLRTLFYLIEGECYTITAATAPQKAEESKGLDRTMTLIDAFLSSLPQDAATTTELPTADVSADYMSYWMREQGAEAATPETPTSQPMKGQSLIDDFIEQAGKDPALLPLKTEDDEDAPPPVDDMVDEESYFTETLAKIYIRQQRYSKALEIIRKLNLKYPKKNAYFADQIRFLEKLIINSKSK